MHYDGNIIRPPSEADSIILQVTTGCSHNKCTFCGAYKDKLFTLKDSAIIDEDIDFASTYCKRQTRLFLADGDALILPFKVLKSILLKIQSKLPWVRHVTLYGNAKAIRSKSIDELQELKSLGLKRIYLGLESGHNTVLSSICKGESSASMIEASQKVRKAGIFLSATVLLGIAGKHLSLEHARETGKVLNKMKPKQIAALTYMPITGTPLDDDIRANKFALLSSDEILKELHELIDSVDLQKVQFFANHASNYLPLSGRLPRDKELFLSMIDQALTGGLHLKPERLRAL